MTTVEGRGACGRTPPVLLPRGQWLVNVAGLAGSAPAEAPVSSPGCCTLMNRERPSGVKYGPVASASIGMFAKRKATPRLAPLVGIMKIALFAW